MSYYDYKAQVVQHRASTHLGGIEKDWFGYDFVGNVTAHKTEHKPSPGTSLIETTTQTYDLWGTGHHPQDCSLLCFSCRLKFNNHYIITIKGSRIYLRSLFLFKKKPSISF